ncbi:MAG: alpha/beta hydrolase [Candidatus Didemnitutus sp.]|nr:alpha/beta hydrolase [Candidatus Didemnitutus sp.]
MKLLFSFLLIVGAAWTSEVPPTPTGFPEAETFAYRDQGARMLLHVVKPADWKPGDQRPVLMFFFGGGWTTGTPQSALGWAKMAAKLGMVGIAPDYRTKQRFDTSPLEAVSDCRAALRWTQENAALLGINPAKIVAGGNSAGGHVALWTAITESPPGSAASEAPILKPAGLILFSTVSDTSVLSGYTPQRFGNHAMALSPIHQLDPAMPPVLAFHGDADRTVPVSQAIALHDKLVASGNASELIIVPGGGHNFGTEFPEWREKARARVQHFLAKLGLIPDPIP